jgi:hypothetical protein
MLNVDQQISDDEVLREGWKQSAVHCGQPDLSRY